MDVDRTEQEDLSRRAGRQSLRDRLSASDGGDLILTQSDVLAKECLQVRIRLRRARQGGRGDQDQQCHYTSDHGALCHISHFQRLPSLVLGCECQYTL